MDEVVARLEDGLSKEAKDRALADDRLEEKADHLARPAGLLLLLRLLALGRVELGLFAAVSLPRPASRELSEVFGLCGNHCRGRSMV